MQNTRTLFRAAALALPLALTSVASASADESFQVDENGIASCEYDGNAKATRGELSTQFANQFWSHLACAKWDEAYEILDAAPKMDMDQYPLATIPEEARTPFESCYFNSFAYGGYEAFYHTPTRDHEGRSSVKHGFFRFSEERFSDIQAAVAYECFGGM